MKLFMGGYGTASLNNIPYIDYIYDNKIDIKINDDILVNHSFPLR